MVVNYLKDVSTVLATVSAVQTGKITHHLQTERQMLKLIFAFDHINHACYNSFQHVFLTNLLKHNPQVFGDRFKYGFGDTSLCETFSTIHGDVVTEHFNEKSGRTARPYRGGYIHCAKCVQIQSFFWSVLSRIQTEYGEILRIPPYSVRIRENTDEKKLRIWTLFTQ